LIAAGAIRPRPGDLAPPSHKKADLDFSVTEPVEE
jgi:hypothetical protein